jgi:sulfate/thiosulfate transport system permease protein
VSLDAAPVRVPTARRVLPGYAGTLGFTWLYLSLIVLIPLAALVVRASGVSWSRAVALMSEPRVLSSIQLSIRCALIAALLNVGVGGVVAWVLARYEFPGRTFLDAMVDLPFALPTSVAGITLTYLYAENGVLGRPLEKLGIHVAFTPVGIVLALAFVGMPFAVRTVQSVIEAMDRAPEEAARALGASWAQTFWRVQLPQLVPALLTGFALALARALGEYGSVLFISGNLPNRTEIAPLLVVSRLEEYDYAGASLIATAMLVASLVLLGAAQLAERWASTHYGAEEPA